MRQALLDRYWRLARALQITAGIGLFVCVLGMAFSSAYAVQGFWAWLIAGSGWLVAFMGAQVMKEAVQVLRSGWRS